MTAIGILLEQGLVGPARDHLFHHHETTLLRAIGAAWTRRPRQPPQMRDLFPTAWRLWFHDHNDDRAARAKRLLDAFER